MMPDLPTIVTRRLRLRPWRLEDTDALHRMWLDPGVRQYLWDNEEIPRERAVEVVRSHLDSVASFGIGYWIVSTNPAEELIGFVGFRQIDDGAEIEMLYGLLPSYWGSGLATEAAQAALDYLWRNTAYARVWARTDPPNERSVQVMRRLQMQAEPDAEGLICYVLCRPVD